MDMSRIISAITDETFSAIGSKDRTFITLGFKIFLRMGLLLRLGPNVITDGTFITLGSRY